MPINQFIFLRILCSYKTLEKATLGDGCGIGDRQGK